ncbi:PspA/IM30 family protein [Bacillus sporothermodurans]|uniref:PspA/IM30 family protein n=1 Tax=Heyndrickxia sporothermodurans TaxID=46224 RepID=UPI00192B836C|nr:PspA/IM30 family protein [Heyndrickxia sporothermodurans]MBL5800211.1 PspA/IM30 family protein [Heyndrickxia sporothermodurans]MBL5812063.1 PspA/IM30 family protein [Heyndrickxia sporothermodurans]MBL5814839.1 PspA/IM30 family protein [Heyndrickxia sporothermodurans]MBL5818232.1 PspA/IM30 family protein [Heyndrickxia sporothermodurans]MBL5843455.1 PspA/IM30 family protein [Heyndrickxia sporothermodurans]
MTTLFEKIKNTVLADLNAVMDKKEEKNPIALLNQYLRESENETNKLGKLIERQYMLKEEFYRELQQAEFMAEKRKKQAKIALAANEESLYETAIHEEAMYNDQVTRLKEAYTQVTVQLEDLEKRHREMKLKLKDMHFKRMELMGKENAMKANAKVNTVLDQSVVGKATNRFEETERYMEQLESKINTGYEQSLFDIRMQQLEKGLDQEGENK